MAGFEKKARDAMIRLGSLIRIAMLAGLLPVAAATATPAFDPVFGDHAVLQRDAPLRLWGTAPPRTRLTLSLGSRTVAAVSGRDGAWRATLPPLPAGGPYRIAVSGAGGTAILDDIMLGDVFLCGGQSNMSYQTRYATNAMNQLKAAADPGIRFAVVPRREAPVAEPRLAEPLAWTIAAPDTIGESPAVCYYMALAMRRAADVTIGLVRSSLGATRIESWMSAGALAGVGTVAGPTTPEPAPTALYNAMIAPLAPYGLKGVVWYQGESNVAEARDYARLLPAFLADWRRAFEAPALPFAIVQLSAFGPAATRPGGSDWAALRDVQRRVSERDQRTALIVSLDTGDRFDIHPAQKRIVGERAARALLRLGRGEAAAGGGPRPLRAARRGDDIVVTFADAADGLRTYSAAGAIGFETCDAARRCAYAEARAAGDAVVLLGSGRGGARYVRYAWADTPMINLFGGDDTPVGSFELPVE